MKHALILCYMYMCLWCSECWTLPSGLYKPHSDGVPNGQPGVAVCVSRFVVWYQPLSCLTLVLHTVGGPALKSVSV